MLRACDIAGLKSELSTVCLREAIPTYQQDLLPYESTYHIPTSRSPRGLEALCRAAQPLNDLEVVGDFVLSCCIRSFQGKGLALGGINWSGLWYEMVTVNPYVSLVDMRVLFRLASKRLLLSKWFRVSRYLCA